MERSFSFGIFLFYQLRNGGILVRASVESGLSYFAKIKIGIDH